MLDTVDLDGLHRSALEGREQHAAQRVTERITIATLERLDADARDPLGNLLYRHLRSDEF